MSRLCVHGSLSRQSSSIGSVKTRPQPYRASVFIGHFCHLSSVDLLMDLCVPDAAKIVGYCHPTHKAEFKFTLFPTSPIQPT
mmetsp:Transcript_43791/g.116970  ORF Transcript_43791/g.116970 Transcript_43791/m.116970 type:complete len:82 (+) Transcript_43791:151-396(+)